MTQKTPVKWLFTNRQSKLASEHLCGSCLLGPSRGTDKKWDTLDAMRVLSPNPINQSLAGEARAKSTMVPGCASTFKLSCWWVSQAVTPQIWGATGSPDASAYAHCVPPHCYKAWLDLCLPGPSPALQIEKSTFFRTASPKHCFRLGPLCGWVTAALFRKTWLQDTGLLALLDTKCSAQPLPAAPAMHRAASLLPGASYSTFSGCDSLKAPQNQLLNKTLVGFLNLSLIY